MAQWSLVFAAFLWSEKGCEFQVDLVVVWRVGVCLFSWLFIQPAIYPVLVLLPFVVCALIWSAICSFTSFLCTFSVPKINCDSLFSQWMAIKIGSVKGERMRVVCVDRRAFLLKILTCLVNTNGTQSTYAIVASTRANMGLEVIGSLMKWNAVHTCTLMVA